jgi:hypothetical protein
MYLVPFLDPHVRLGNTGIVVLCYLHYQESSMDAKTLPQLRTKLRQAEAAYRETRRQYVIVYGDLRDLAVIDAHVQRCRRCGTALTTALNRLIDALGHRLTDEDGIAEYRRLQAQRVILTSELRLLGP